MSRRFKENLRPKKDVAPAETASPLTSRPENHTAAHNLRWLIPGICLLIAAATWVVFGQTVRYEFVNFDDDIYVYENRPDHRRPDTPGDRMGTFLPQLLLLLGTPAGALPHAGLPALRALAGRPPFDKCPAPWRNGGPAVSGSEGNDRGALAQRIRGQCVCHPSIASGIGGVGHRTQGRIERIVFRADTRCVCKLCAPPWRQRVPGPLPCCGVPVRDGVDVQAAIVGDAALRAAAA